MTHFPDDWLKHSPARAHKRDIETILRAALDAVDPINAVRNCVFRSGDTLQIGRRAYDLRRYRHVYIVGGGKASGAMAEAIEQLLGDTIAGGLINVKVGYTADTRIVELNEAGHPIPDAAGVEGARRMADLLRQAGPDDLVISLISGGGSALMTLPVEGVSLADMEQLTDALLRCGATIIEFNTVRKHLSQIKGGNLARLAYPATLATLILSDVVGNPLDTIASGPTVPDTTTFTDAYGVLSRFELLDAVPAAIIQHLRRGVAGEITETPKAGDPVFEDTCNLVIGSNAVAARAAVDKAEGLGYNALLLSTFVEGEAREVAKVLTAIAREIADSGHPVPRPACVVAGGETTVTVQGQGKGGRNQELALAAAIALQDQPGVAIVTLATDGTDGPTDAAGALADGTTVERAQGLGLDPVRYLAENDAYPFFQTLGDLLVTGPTNTNVNDLIFVFAWEIRDEIRDWC